MAGTYIGKYDTTAGSNSATASNSVSVAEGMLPSNINNALRDIMADVRQWYNTAEWIEYGDGAGTYTATYASGTSFTIDGVNVTTPYHAGRRVKLVASTPGDALTSQSCEASNVKSASSMYIPPDIFVKLFASADNTFDAALVPNVARSR